MIAAPIGDDTRPLGALEVYSTRPHAFDDDDAALVGALADHAAVALITARQMADLTESRAESSRRADAERSLREIAARLTAIREPSEVIQHAVDESVRLLAADQARIELDDAATGTLRAAYISAADRTVPLDDRGPRRSADRDRGRRQGRRRRPAVLHRRLPRLDDRFVHDAKEDAYVEQVGLRSVLSVPLVGDDGHHRCPVGRREPRAMPSPRTDAALLEALATQVSVAFATARLIEALDRSSRGHRAAGGSRARPARDRRPDHGPARPGDDPRADRGRGRPAARRRTARRSTCSTRSAPRAGSGSGSGPNATGRTGRRTGPSTLLDIDAARGIGDLGRGPRARRAGGDRRLPRRRLGSTTRPRRDAFIRAEGIHSVMAAPLTTEDGPVGVINVHSVRPDAFGPDELRIIGAIADLATIAVTNARLHRTSSTARPTSSSGGPTSNVRCARSPSASPASAIPPRCSSSRSTKPSGSSAPTVRSSTCSTPSGTCCAAPTTRRWPTGCPTIGSVARNSCSVAVCPAERSSSARSIVTGDYLDRRPVRARPGRGRLRPRGRDPVDDRGPAHRRRWSGRRPRGLLGSAGRVRDRRGGRPRGVRRPGRRCDRQCAAVRAARGLRERSTGCS